MYTHFHGNGDSISDLFIPQKRRWRSVFIFPINKNKACIYISTGMVLLFLFSSFPRNEDEDMFSFFLSKRTHVSIYISTGAAILFLISSLPRIGIGGGFDQPIANELHPKPDPTAWPMPIHIPQRPNIKINCLNLNGSLQSPKICILPRHETWKRQNKMKPTTKVQKS